MQGERALYIFLHPSQLTAAWKAGYIEDQPDGTMILNCPFLERAIVLVTKPIPKVTP